MIHPWQQPSRPLEVHPDVAAPGVWHPVLFLRVGSDGESVEVMTISGNVWATDRSMLRLAVGMEAAR